MATRFGSAKVVRRPFSSRASSIREKVDLPSVVTPRPATKASGFNIPELKANVPSVPLCCPVALKPKAFEAVRWTSAIFTDNITCWDSFVFIAFITAPGACCSAKFIAILAAEEEVASPLNIMDSPFALTSIFSFGASSYRRFFS